MMNAFIVRQPSLSLPLFPTRDVSLCMCVLPGKSRCRHDCRLRPSGCREEPRRLLQESLQQAACPVIQDQDLAKAREEAQAATAAGEPELFSLSPSLAPGLRRLMPGAGKGSMMMCES